MAGPGERGGRGAGGSGEAQAQGQPTVVLERQMAALRIEEDEAVEEGVQKFFDLLTRLEGADLNNTSISRRYGRGRGRGQGGGRFGGSNYNGGRGSGSYGNDNMSYGRGCERGAGGGRGRGCGGRGGRGGGAANMKSGDNDNESSDDRFPGQFFFVSTQSSAATEKVEGFEEPAAVGKVTLHSLDYWVIDSGATYSMTPRADLLTELEPSLVKHVTSALRQRAKVKGMGKAMFKGADGKMVGLKNVIWVSNLAANLISVWRLQKAGMVTSSTGAKTYTARIGERMQVAASVNTEGETVGSGYGANDGAKAKESNKCIPRGTSKQCEHEESGAATKEQHKGEENPKAAAEEEYGESMWGTIASVAFSNPTSPTGECDWLTCIGEWGHVSLRILQQLVKTEMVADIRMKGEPNEVLGCATCMQAKFTRFPFSGSEAKAKAPLHEVVMDVMGPLKLGAAGAEYFLTIVDV
ncbi:unnamed protein product [Closterium sp. NIES-53]